MNAFSMNSIGTSVSTGEIVLKYHTSSCETIITLIFDEEDLLFIYGRITSWENRTEYLYILITTGIVFLISSERFSGKYLVRVYSLCHNPGKLQ